MYDEEPFPNICIKRFSFACDVVHDDNSIFLDINWFIEDSSVKEETLAYTKLPAKLSYDEIVECNIVQSYGFTVRILIATPIQNKNN